MGKTKDKTSPNFIFKAQRGQLLLCLVLTSTGFLFSCTDRDQFNEFYAHLGRQWILLYSQVWFKNF